MVDGTVAPVAHRRVSGHDALVKELMDTRHYPVEIRCPMCGHYTNGVPAVEDTPETRTVCAHCKQAFVWYLLGGAVQYHFSQRQHAPPGRGPVTRDRLQGLKS